MKLFNFLFKKKTAKTFKIKTIKDLAEVLNVKPQKLMAMANKTVNHYELIVLHKPNGKIRLIHSPSASLKYIQRQILNNFLINEELSVSATAYKKGASLVQNAKPHVNHKYLLKMDIMDFFDSISSKMVLTNVFNSKKYPKAVGIALTHLCCLEWRLPQGAPTSPMISNIVMKRFDEIILNWCKKRGVTYTRYCDDLTFSSNTPLYNVYLKVNDTLNKFGFRINKSKTKFISSASRQTVTGLTVNKKVSITKDYKAKLRQELFYANKYGIRNSIIKGKKFKFIKYGTPNLEKYYNHLLGKLDYLLQIEPKNKWFLENRKLLKQKYLIECKK